MNVSTINPEMAFVNILDRSLMLEIC